MLPVTTQAEYIQTNFTGFAWRRDYAYIQIFSAYAEYMGDFPSIYGFLSIFDDDTNRDWGNVFFFIVGTSLKFSS